MTNDPHYPCGLKGGNDGGGISRHRPDGQGHGGEPAEGRAPGASMGQKTYRVDSEPRHANIDKIAGNLMVACAIEATAEAAALLRKYRMSAPDVLDVIITSLFNVPVYQGYGRAIGHRQYVPPGFDLVLGMKDVGLALKAGEQANVPLPFASVLRDAFIEAIANGDADKDWSAIARVAGRKAGLED